MIPYIVNELDKSGTELRKSPMMNGSSLDATATLAASTLDFNLSTLVTVPELLSRYFLSIRLLKIYWPIMLKESSSWPKDGLSFSPGTVRQLLPWFSEFTNYSAMARYYKDLNCTPTDNNCNTVKAQTQAVLQKAAAWILMSEKIKKLTNDEGKSNLVSEIPEAETIRILEPIIESIINTDNTRLISNNGKAIMSAFNILSFSADTREIEFDLRNNLLAQTLAFSRTVIDDENQAALFAIKIALTTVYKTYPGITDPGYFKKFISVKKLYDIVNTTKTYSLNTCDTCLDRLQLWENNAINILVKESRDIHSNIIDLLNDSPVTTKGTKRKLK